jgi:hypothetical protein
VEDAAAGTPLLMDPAITTAMREIVAGAAAPGADLAFIARAMALPSEGELLEMVAPADPDVIHAARDFVVKSLAADLRPELEAALAAGPLPPPRSDPHRLRSSLPIVYLCTRTYSPHPPPWHGHPFADRPRTVYQCTRTHTPRAPPCPGS